MVNKFFALSSFCLALLVGSLSPVALNSAITVVKPPTTAPSQPMQPGSLSPSAPVVKDNAPAPTAPSVQVPTVQAPVGGQTPVQPVVPHK